MAASLSGARPVELERETKDYTDFTVCIAMDYGGHDELIRTIQYLAKNKIEASKENIEKHLDTKGIVPPPDFIIRTSGEQRLSGFMSWQAAYAELYFPKQYFPDFTPQQLEMAIEDYSKRDRRFGGDSKNK